MAEYSLTDARAQLPHLLDRVAAGETITITRHGQPVGVIMGHGEWVRSQTRSTAMEQASRLRELREAAKKKSWDDLKLLDNYDAESHIGEIRAGRDEQDLSRFVE